MNFGKAIEEMKSGKKVARDGTERTSTLNLQLISATKTPVAIL